MQNIRNFCINYRLFYLMENYLGKLKNIKKCVSKGFAEVIKMIIGNAFEIYFINFTGIQ